MVEALLVYQTLAAVAVATAAVVVVVATSVVVFVVAAFHEPVQPNCVRSNVAIPSEYSTTPPQSMPDTIFAKGFPPKTHDRQIERPQWNWRHHFYFLRLSVSGRR